MIKILKEGKHCPHYFDNVLQDSGKVKQLLQIHYKKSTDICLSLTYQRLGVLSHQNWCYGIFVFSSDVDGTYFLPTVLCFSSAQNCQKSPSKQKCNLYKTSSYKSLTSTIICSGCLWIAVVKWRSLFVSLDECQRSEWLLETKNDNLVDKQNINQF